MQVSDYFPQGKRWWFRLHEKGGKRHEMPVHHNLEEYLDSYIAAAGIKGEPKSSLFRASNGKTKILSDRQLDRLARSLPHLIALVNQLAGQGVAFKSITEQIDTSSATGQLTFHLFGALAEFERNLIKEQTIAGLSAARARGKSGGRPKRSPTASKVALAKKLCQDKTNSIPQICRYLNISRATLFRYIKEP